MKQYIEREAALSLCGWYNTVNGKSICAARKDELAALPAADVVEVKRGRWKGYGMGDYSCSLCMEIVSGNRYNFCPNCGADMREVREDG